MKIYVASSWRNYLQPMIVNLLRAARHEVYDFRHPDPNDTGFSWRDIAENWRGWKTEEFIAGLEHPVAQAGYDSDMNAMEWADVGVLVLGAGASAHMETGWFCGNPNKRAIILLAPDYDDSEGYNFFRMQGHRLLRDAPCSECGDLDGCHMWREEARREALERPFEPELMYKMADAIVTAPADVLAVLEAMEIDDHDHSP